MRLVVVSHKPCWEAPESPSGYATDGGFPFQMAALAELFDHTTLLLPRRRGPAPPGLAPLQGHALAVRTLPEPAGLDLRRKLALLGWLPRHLPALWREIRRADAVHAPVPGDIGFLALLLALLLRKPLFVRHCGTWGRPGSVADRLLLAVLTRVAGGRNVVLATGGGTSPPEPRNASVEWIFSTSLSEAALAALPRAEPWRPGQPLRLASLGRLTRGKNARAAIEALALLRGRHPGAVLEVMGHGAERASLERRAQELGMREAVIFHGNLPQERVLERLAASHFLLFPTRVAEGFPKAALEAMACGVPVVAPPVSVLGELLAEGRGVVLDDVEPATVAAAVERVLDDPAGLVRMAAAARRHAAQYSLERWGEEIGQRLRAAWGRPTREDFR